MIIRNGICREHLIGVDYNYEIQATLIGPRLKTEGTYTIALVCLSVCMSVRPEQFISGTPQFVFLKICMELDIHNIRTATGPFFRFRVRAPPSAPFFRIFFSPYISIFDIFRLFGAISFALFYVVKNT